MHKMPVGPQAAQPTRYIWRHRTDAALRVRRAHNGADTVIASGRRPRGNLSYMSAIAQMPLYGSAAHIMGLIRSLRAAVGRVAISVM